MSYSRYKELINKAKLIVKDSSRRDPNKLHAAVCELSFLQPEHIPELYKSEVTAFMELFDNGTPAGDEGIIMASINDMNPKEVKQHLKKIESFF